MLSGMHSELPHSWKFGLTCGHLRLECGVREETLTEAQPRGDLGERALVTYGMHGATI